MGRTATLEPTREMLAPREVPLGGPRAMIVRRTLPHRNRRTVGPWCFVDDYGPDDIAGRPGMRVPPHPHIGLQTVSWLLEGEVLHRDSLKTTQLIRPGQLNLMTAGRGISHSEESPADHSRVLRGVQLWVALPDEHRHIAPLFEHHGELPVLSVDGATATVVMGGLGEVRSPARTYSPLVAADVALAAGVNMALPLDVAFEHAVLVLDGPVRVDGIDVPAGSLFYLGTGRAELPLGAGEPARVLLLGGPPFEESLLMWWNFVGRNHDEIVQARADWEAARQLGEPGGRFGVVRGYPGDPLPAPALPTTRLKPRPRMITDP